MATLIPLARVFAVSVIGITIAGCSGGTAGPPAPAPAVDVDATIQAAVHATVQAAVPPTVQATIAAPALKATPVPTSAVTRLTNENWGLALTDASPYKDVPVSLSGKVFLDPQLTTDAIAFQIYTNSTATDGNTIIVGPTSLKVQKDDFVRIEGKVFDMFEGKNAFGGTLRVPRVMASSVTVVSREDVIAPALKKYAVDQTLTQHGLAITLQRVELAEQETRVYVSVANQTTEKASVYVRNARLFQGSRQFEAKSVYNSGYLSMPSDMLGGVVASTVIVFDAVAPGDAFRVVWDGPRLGDYSLKFTPYQWSVSDAGGMPAAAPAAVQPAAPLIANGATPASPQSIVAQFYSLINTKNLQPAWDLQSPHRQSALTYKNWAAGNATTQSIEAPAITDHTQTGAAATVSVTVVSVDTQGASSVTKQFQGSWDLVLVNGAWKLGAPNIKQTQ